MTRWMPLSTINNASGVKTAKSVCAPLNRANPNKMGNGPFRGVQTNLRFTFDNYWNLICVIGLLKIAFVFDHTSDTTLRLSHQV